MRTQNPSVPGYYLQQIADQLGSMDIDVAGWLRSCGLSLQQLDQADLKISLETFRHLILDALRRADEPALGLLVGERLLVNTHGLLGYAAINSETIRQLLALIEQFLPLRTNLVTISHEIQTDCVALRFEQGCPLLEAERPILEAVVLALKNILDFITMGSCQIQGVYFSFPEYDGTGLARALFKCDVHYEQAWTGFTFALELLDRRLKMANPASFRDAALICQREMEKRAAAETMSSQLKRLLLETRNGFPALQVTARLFNMSARTLHRRLIEEGTSYKAVLEEVKHRLAFEYLKAGELSVQEIAYRLGYQDVANFRRAFKRWQGMPPAEYKAACREGSGDLNG